MTDEERKIALYCLKVSSDYHSEVCQECIKFPNCDHVGKDDVTETIIKALEQEHCEDAVSRKELIEWMENYKARNNYYHPYSKNKSIPFEEVVRIIEEIPPTAPKQWTCKECKWWDKETHHCKKWGFDNTWKHDGINEDWDIEIYRTTREDFYCANFKRKEQSDDEKRSS